MLSTSRLLLLAFVTSLAACGIVPQQQTQVTPSAPGAGTDMQSPQFVPQPNPYLAQEQQISPQAQALFQQARDAMAAEQWQRAETLLLELAQANPDLSGPWLNLGLVYRAQAQTAQAAQAFERAFTVNELNTEAYNQRAILHREQGEFAEAEKLYQKALQVWPHNSVVHRNLGILYELYMGRFAQALQHYRMSQQLSPESERQLEGWIVDLERRLADQQAAN